MDSVEDDHSFSQNFQLNVNSPPFTPAKHLPGSVGESIFRSRQVDTRFDTPTRSIGPSLSAPPVRTRGSGRHARSCARIHDSQQFEPILNGGSSDSCRRQLFTVCATYSKGDERCEFCPQSGVEGASISQASESQKKQNMRFSDNMASYENAYEAVMDATRSDTDMGDATLENFFSRPIKIASYEWGTSTTLAEDLNPWQAYFENPRVINRIVNYNLLRCNLRVKVVINGNGFQYGRALVSYLPMQPTDNLSSNAALIRQDLIQASQQPKIFLDPTTSTGGELLLPFFYYKNNLNIPQSDWRDLGEMYFRSLNTLKHANGAQDQVTISVFAWAEDVTMSVLTSNTPGTLVPQSGVESEIDEVNKTGVISGPATVVAKIAGSLTKVPTIGPFALATHMGATTMARIAKMFGYCRPSVTKDPDIFKPAAVSHLAVTTVSDQMQKLTIDDKQELTIDPGIAGIGGGDQLDIGSIARRESYLTTFAWDIGTSPETLLFNMRVDPCTFANSGTGTLAYHFPATAMAAMPFRYWTGTMKYRFQVVCSAFHKGRLKIVYDPQYLSGSEYNVNYMEIVDIADKTDFTIEVANGQEYTLLSHALPGENSESEMFSTTQYTNIAGFGNGVIGVYVVNELTTPNSDVNNDIEVNVFVSAGDDFEVFVPDDHYQTFVAKPLGAPALNKAKFEAQSGEEIVADSQNTSELNAPEQSISTTIGPMTGNTDNLNKVFAGEAVRSFRCMLKRYMTHGILCKGEPSSGEPDVDDFTLCRGSFPSFPYLRGSVAGAVHETREAIPYNYCNTVLLHWVTWGFSGWRGSVRWKFLPRGHGDKSNQIIMAIQRSDIVAEPYFTTRGPAPTYFSESQAAEAQVRRVQSTRALNTGMLSGAQGVAYSHGQINPHLEVEFPFYNFLRFLPGKREDYTGTGFQSPQPLECMQYNVQMPASETGLVASMCAAGEDFTTYFFTGLPRLYYEGNPPLPP